MLGGEGLSMHHDVMGVDLGGTRLRLQAGGCKAQLDTGSQFAPQDLLQGLTDFVARHQLRPTRIGLAVPGLVGADGQVVACDVLPAFTGWQAQLGLTDLCGVVTVLNDVEAALLDEAHDAPPGHIGAVVMVGTAIGAAFMVDGKSVRGASGWAGELGYWPLAVGSGQVRRLDDLAGGAALATACGVSSAQLAAQAATADPTTLQAIATSGRFLGLGLAALIHLLNPARLAVGGGTVDLPGYWDAAYAAAREHTLAQLWADCTLTRVRSGASAVVNGAVRAAQASSL